MLVIRMQRTGRKGHAMFRIVVQDSRLTPTSGKVVAALGSYDPHAKAVILDQAKAAFYLEHGAQPSTRVARLLQAEDVKLPDWVQLPADKVRTVKNAEKRRSTAPAQPVEEQQTPVAETPAAEGSAPTAAAPAAEATTEAETAPAADAAPTETPAEEAVAAAPPSEVATVPAGEADTKDEVDGKGEAVAKT